MKIRRGFVDTPAGQAHYVTAGEGAPVIFLHASPNSWNYYTDIIPIVVAGGFRFIGMDTMGYGDSERPDPPFTEVAQYAECVVALLDGLGLAKASVVGHLTGSGIAHEVGAGWPDRVEKLVLSEVFNWNKPERLAVHERIHFFVEPQADGAHLIRLWNRVAVRTAQTAGARVADRMFLNQLKVNIGDQPVDAYGTMGWDGSAPWALCHYPLWDRAPLITAPTLIMHGVNSDLRNVQPNLQQAITGSRVVSYQAENRNGPVENPQGWTGLILDFLREPVAR